MTKHYKETFRQKGTTEIEMMYWKVQDDITIKLCDSLSEFGWEVYKTNTCVFDWDEVEEITEEEFDKANKEVLDKINNFGKNEIRQKKECDCYYTKFCKSTNLEPNEYCRENGK